MIVVWIWVVVVEMVISGYILKVKLIGFVGGLDVECERKVCSLNNWVDGGVV